MALIDDIAYVQFALFKSIITYHQQIAPLSIDNRPFAILPIVHGTKIFLKIC